MRTEAGRADGEHRTGTGSLVPAEAWRASPGPKKAIPALPTSPKTHSCSCRRALCSRQLCRVPPSPAPSCALLLSLSLLLMEMLCSFQLCFVCGKRGASITCAEMGCDRSFHFPCAAEGQCVTQFFGQHRCFCLEHLPQQPLETAPTQDTTCIICMEPVGLSRSYCTMVCPACQHAWFHRACIQGMAKSAGLCCFQCPLCRDREVFIQEMVNLGIHIPARLVSFSQLSRHEGTRAQVPAQGLSRQAWP
uniref:RING-type domain-containing protein n=1 Tax=Phasianus colchicus TaxID=9054 RepID=A0A669QAH6_PHACC